MTEDALDGASVRNRGGSMPKVWGRKRERQYEHIKEGYEEKGVKTKEAKERAARTVNARRAAAGEARTDSGPTKSELYEKAKSLGIEGRSSMNKEQLENAIAGSRGGKARSDSGGRSGSTRSRSGSRSSRSSRS